MENNDFRCCIQKVFSKGFPEDIVGMMHIRVLCICIIVLLPLCSDSHGRILKSLIHNDHRKKLFSINTRSIEVTVLGNWHPTIPPGIQNTSENCNFEASIKW